MKTLQFDINGNITPAEFVELDLMEIESNLVTNFPRSVIREKIFSGYKSYCHNLLQFIHSEFEQWLDGSFTTTKLNPNDVDLVNWIDVDTVGALKDLLNPFHTRTGNPKTVYHVDGYLAFVCDKSDKRYPLYQSWYDYWKKWFGHDRNGLAKGIITRKVQVA
jgi:hypothetical protein